MCCQRSVECSDCLLPHSKRQLDPPELHSATVRHGHLHTSSAPGPHTATSFEYPDTHFCSRSPSDEQDQRRTRRVRVLLLQRAILLSVVYILPPAGSWSTAPRCLRRQKAPNKAGRQYRVQRPSCPALPPHSRLSSRQRNLRPLIQLLGAYPPRSISRLSARSLHLVIYQRQSRVFHEASHALRPMLFPACL